MKNEEIRMKKEKYHSFSFIIPNEVRQRGRCPSLMPRRGESTQTGASEARPPESNKGILALKGRHNLGWQSRRLDERVKLGKLRS